MDWKLLVIGLIMTVVGALVCWRFRASRFMHEMTPGCAMAFGILLAGTGIIAIVFGFLFKA